MKVVTYKEHIRNYFIDGIGRLLNEGHWIESMNIMCNGIELLGKFLDTKHDIHKRGLSEKHFCNVLRECKSLNKYDVKFQTTKNGVSVDKSCLYSDLRCAFDHGLMNGDHINLSYDYPKDSVGIVSKGSKHIISIKAFYRDFVIACNQVMSSTDSIVQKRLSETAYEVFQMS